MTATPKRASAAIVGVAESDLGVVVAGTSPLDLMSQAIVRALDECGLSVSDIDGVFTAASQLRMPTISLCEYMGIRPAYSDSSFIGGASFQSLAAHAAVALEAGLCNVAVIAYGSTQRSARGTFTPQRDLNDYDAPFKPRLPVTGYALAAARHMNLYGTTRTDLADIALAARGWAQLNPRAFDRRPLTREDVLNAPMVSSPLGVKDCCLVTDGGAAVIMVRADRAKDLKKAPIYLLGSGEAQEHHTISQMPDLVSTGAARSGALAYAMAGLTASDIDVAQLYDAFTITTLLFLEDLGFCPKGEGGRFVQDGAIAPGGKLPVNTSGGGLSYCHPGMFGLFTMVEATRQLRGECGERQVDNPQTAIAHGNGGVLAGQSTLILGTSATV